MDRKTRYRLDRLRVVYQRGEPTLEAMCRLAAETGGIDPVLVYAEALAILAELRQQPRSIQELARQDGLDVDAFERLAAALRVTWAERA